MADKKYKYIYGPVSSWRLGRSFGIDPIYRGRGKVCSFDCIYCQVGRTRLLTDKRRIFVPADKIIEEIKSLPPLKIDYITFSGCGEPTLAKNLGEIIKKIKKVRKEKTAVLTNAAIIYKKDVQDDLLLADFVMAKLDAHSQELFTKINKPQKALKFKRIIKGLRQFRSRYRGKFALQIMFVKENASFAKEIAELAERLKPDEIQLNTPLRPCGVKPLPKKELDKIKKFFSASPAKGGQGGSAYSGKGTNCVSVYRGKKKKTKPISKKDVLKRRGEI